MKTIKKTLQELLENSEKSLLIVVDAQVDFASGALGQQECYAALKRAVPFIKGFKGTVVYTKDTHDADNYFNTEEGRRLPVLHTVKGTEGWELIPEIKEFLDPETAIIFEKDTFGSRRLAAWLDRNPNRFDAIYLVGLDTEYCVISNAILAKTYCPNVPINVIATYCCGATDWGHDDALCVMWNLHTDIIEIEE